MGAQIFSPFNLTLATLVVAAIFFMSGKVRSDIVALCALLLLMLLGILEPAEAMAGFSNPVVVMMVGLFVVGAGIFRTGLAKVVSSHILRLAGDNETLLFLLVMLVPATLGSFISNTGTVAMMMPIVAGIAAASGKNVRRYLMPMAFASALGMFTLISTSPNLVIKEVLTRNGFEPISFFSFAPIGAVCVVVGITMLFFLSRLLPKDGEGGKKKRRSISLSKLVEEYNVATHIFKTTVPEDSPLVGRRIGELEIASTYFISIVKISHKHFVSHILLPTVEEEAGPKSVIRQGDTLYCYGIQENINHFASDYELSIEHLSRSEAAQHFKTYGIAEAFIMPDSTLVNHTVRESRFRELFNVTVLGIKRQGEYDITDITDTKLHAGDSLLIQGTWENVSNLVGRQRDLVLVGQPAKDAAKVTLDIKAPLAALIMVAMIAVMVFNVVPMVTAVLSAAVLMVLTGCIRNMEEAYDSINWNSIVLIGAMIPMATAFEKTGITQSISNALLYGTGEFGPYALLAVIYCCTSLLTLVLSNTGTAVLFAPIALQTAVSMNISPYPLLFAVAVAATMSFSSPFSTPPNAMVMSAGKYSFKDYIKIGLPLQVVIGIVMILLLPWLFPF